MYEALPDDVRGKFFVTASLKKLTGYGEILHGDPRRSMSKLVVVSSERDRQRARFANVIRMEHGIGLSYAGDARSGTHPSYAGGYGQKNVVSFLAVNEWNAKPWRASYPGVPVPIVGSPKLDALLEVPRPSNSKPVVAVSFHWDCTIVAETRTAFGEFSRELVALSKRDDIELLGHSHPVFASKLRQWYWRHGIEFVPTFEEVVRRADVYAVDNSSTLYEFAALDRPVIVLNSRRYRRDVHHGLRFWEHSDVGVNADAGQLEEALEVALRDGPVNASARREATSAVFPWLGRATERAVSAIRDRVD